MSEEAVSAEVQEVIAPEPQSLDDILNDVPPEEETGAGDTEPEVAEEAKAEPESKEEEKPKEEDSTPESEEPAKEPWQITAVQDERKKRQKSDARADEADAKYAELLARTTADSTEKVDIFDDPDKVLSNMENRFSQQIRDAEANMSENMMRATTDDYDELKSEFLDLMDKNPLLQTELANAPIPAQYLYNTAKQARELKDLEDPTALKERYKAEAKAEALAEIELERKTESESLQEKRKSIQPSLTGAQSKGSVDTVAQDSIDDLLNF